ncbi:Hsp40 co-chaperone Jid1 [Drechmeria coniospora]|uniref:Hsp40 co-chaperone Jid1 n=1 Tax=Drechmeria coniospora TaxID=98403 RepID=A0A151GCP5_DRECN|nr:Hsp40 co-chaperone Jid1 [Drechmeria coniospora]KYK54831.1 Hsp40 co-chaperone Jid1 [Drechmeria coniospora]
MATLVKPLPAAALRPLLTSSVCSPASALLSSIPRHGRRRHATARQTPGRHEPPAWPSSPNPTPYEILDLPRDAPYAKQRFIQLVKLYHPDTEHHDGHHLGPSSSSSSPTFLPSASVSASASASAPRLPRAIRLERYRLVVAANDLLGDPAKRRLYDLHGVGWSHGHGAPNLRDADRAWRHRPNSAARNATWEDWERWYEVRSGKPREPTYMSNGLFATLVVAMCMVGALAQANRAESSGADFVEYAQQRNADIGHQMRRDGMARAGRSKDERVDSFLKDRENVAYDYVSSRYDEPRPPPDGTESA